MEDWHKYKLGDVVNVLDSRRVPLSSKERNSRKGIYPYYGAQGIIDYIDDYLFDGTYLLIAEDGENIRSQKENIAQIATGKYWVNNHAHIVESNGNCDIRYICYLLNNMDITGYITGSAQPKLNQANLLSIELDLPSLEKQIIIADFLSLFDKKIELNNRINHNLHLISQALFDHYFIQHTELLGDCSIVHLTDIATYLNGLAMQKYPAVGKGLPVLKIKELGQGCVDSSSDRCSTDIKTEYIVNDGDCIFSWSGTLLVDLWCGGKCGLNQHLFKVSSNKYPKWFYYFWTKHHLASFIHIAKDKAVTMGHIKRTELDNAKVLLPGEKAMKYLNSLFEPILDKIISTRIQNRYLANQRDKLLPKLMSGELKISDLDF